MRAIQRLLQRLGWKADDVDLWEINEAFAVVTMVAMKELFLPHDRVNVNGGACALGHPHAHGKIHVRDDEKFVRGVVARLTRKLEADQPVPWKMGDAPADYLATQLGNIVGIAIRLSRLDGKRKLNQHHRQPDREGAIQGLEAHGNHGLAQAMRDTAKPSAGDE